MSRPNNNKTICFSSTTLQCNAFRAGNPNLGKCYRIHSGDNVAKPVGFPPNNKYSICWYSLANCQSTRARKGHFKPCYRSHTS